MSGLGPRQTPRDLRAASPLTEVHRPRARQAVDVVGAPAYDPSPTPTVHRSKERKCSSRGYNLEVGGSVNRHAPISYSIHLFVTRRGCHPLLGGGSADWYDSDKPESRGHQSDRQSRSS